MKSFEQFIEESYNFRLGGSQQKGYDQNRVKKFIELKEGDELYYWHEDNGSKVKVFKLIEDAHYDYDKEIELTFLNTFRIKGTYHVDQEYEDKEATGSKHVVQWCLATNFNALVDYAKKMFNKTFTEDDIVREEHVEESYSFRLGGSQKKGYDQAKVKTIGELEKGDIVFYCDTSDSFYTSYDVIDLKEHTKDEFSIVVHSRVYKNASPAKLTVKADGCDMSTYVDEYKDGEYDIISTDYKEFVDKIKEIVGIDVTDINGYTANEANQNYSFRLGGSQQKGFEQTKVKTFEELEEGDTLYFGYVYNNKAKVERNIFRRMYEKPVGTTKIHMLVYGESPSSTLETPVPKDKIVYTYKTGPRIHTDVIATDKAAFMKKIEELTAGKNIQIIGLEKLEESYNFRLGGSQKKGFDQKKSFADLERGDTFYFWNSHLGDESKEYILTTKEIAGHESKYYRLYYQYKGESDWDAILKTDIDKSYELPANGDSQWCYATTFEELQYLVKERFNIDIKSFRPSK